MKFTYFKQTGSYYRNCGNGLEEIEDEGYNFDYEPDYDDLKGELPAIMAGDPNLFRGLKEVPDWETRLKICENFVDLLGDADVLEDVAENYREDLECALEERAMETQD